MPKATPVTRSFHKAHESINRSFQMALDKMGRVPFGEEPIDPRTAAARQALYAGMIPTIPFNSNIVQQKNSFPQDIGKHPAPPNVPQNPKTAAAGKVVDPSAIETAQSVDWVASDTSGGVGLGNTISDGEA